MEPVQFYNSTYKEENINLVSSLPKRRAEVGRRDR
jgi:hypothetical protein